MLTPDHEHLQLFEDFRLDLTLPKFKRPEADDLEEMSASDAMLFMSSPGRRRISSRPGNFTTIGSARIMTTSQANALGNATENEFVLTRLQRFLLSVLRWVSPGDGPFFLTRGEPRYTGEITVHEFFSGLKNTASELEIVDRRVRGYEAALKRAEQSGQQALVEQLTAGAAAARAETQLLAIGQTRVLEEAVVVQFVKKCTKGLRLDYVRNFTRHIPDDVLEKKQRCDELGIFDNYAVLHYDPDGKSWAETHQEREARKDPILFGLLDGKRRLYFVADWVDEYCDLTLDGIADVLGNEAVTDLDEDDFGVPS